MIRDELARAIASALAKLGIPDVEVELEHPADLSHGDYSTNVAMAAARRAQLNPKVLAERLVAELGAIDEVEKIEVAGNGFINFYLSRDFYTRATNGVIEKGDAWGRNESLKGKRIMIDHTQPNPFKPFHIGHLISNATGESLARILEASGASVTKVNYQGDIGLHVAKCLWAIQKEGTDTDDILAIGNAYVTGSKAYEDDQTAKAEIDAVNKKLYERSDTRLNELYEKGRKTSLKHFDDIYTTLGSAFDRLYFESETVELGMKAIERGLMEGILEKSDGATVFKGESEGLNTRVFVNSAGIPTYEGKELGLIELKRKEFPFDVALTSTAVEQKNFFEVVTRVAEKLWPEMKGKYVHIAFGMMLLSTGKMSSRKGNVVTGESLIDDMRSHTFEKMKERELSEGEKRDVADIVAVAAIKYAILKQSRIKNIIFGPEASLSFEGDSGPYLQYAYVRAHAVLRKAADVGIRTETLRGSRESVPGDVSVLERILYRFPEVVLRARVEFEPHYITTYLTTLAGAFNSWYANEKIVDASDPNSPYKVALTQAFATTMKNGLWHIGIRAPEKM